MIPSWLFTAVLAADPVALGPPGAAVLVGTGLPNLVGAHLEIWLAEQWTVEIGVGGGLLPPSVEAVGRMRPRALCANCTPAWGWDRPRSSAEALIRPASSPA